MEWIDLLLLAGLLLEGAGFLYKGDKNHRLRELGWAALALYWPLRSPEFIGIGDFTNAFFCLAALPFFLYLAYQEELSFRYGEEHRGLEFISGAAFIAGISYLAVEWVPIISGTLINTVAGQSVWLFNAMTGQHFTVIPVNYSDSEMGAVVPQANIRIVLACTAIQSMFIAAGVILASHGKRGAKIRALALDISAIYLLNLVRNAGVIYLTYYGITSFEVAHNEIGKGGSLIALIILLFITFDMIPELYDDIYSLTELPKRVSRLKRSE